MTILKCANCESMNIKLNIEENQFVCGTCGRVSDITNKGIIFTEIELAYGNVIEDLHSIMGA